MSAPVVAVVAVEERRADADCAHEDALESDEVGQKNAQRDENVRESVRCTKREPAGDGKQEKYSAMHACSLD